MKEETLYMKTLKKTLALVLVLIMALGVFGAVPAAAFTDDAAITYKDAVDLLAALGILDGYEDGSFKPDGILTRAEGVKIIAYLFLAPEVAAALQPTNTGFSDVPVGHWANAVIGWAVDRGIVDGYGDGTFGPSDPLTGLQFAKMILAAFGYGAKGEFLGDRWATNTAQLAQKLGLMKQVVDAMNNTAGLKRQQASQMGYNSILEGINFVRFVEFLNDYVTGDILGSGTGETSLDDKDHYDVANVEGTIGFDATDHTFTFEADDIVAYPFDAIPYANAAPKDYARAVKVLVVKASSAKNAKAIGAITYDDTVLFESGKAVDFAKVTDKTNKDDYKAHADANVEIYLNGEELEYGAGKDFTVTNGVVAFIGNYAGFEVMAGDITIFTGTGKLIEKIIIIYREHAVADDAVADDDEEITINGSTYDIEEAFGYEDIEEDSQLLVTEMFGHIWINELATVEGELTKYAGTSAKPTSYTVGKAYNVSNKVISGDYDIYALTGSLNKEIVLYVDEFDNAIAGEPAEDANSKTYYAFIEAEESTDVQDWGAGKAGIKGYFISMTGEKLAYKLNPTAHTIQNDILKDKAGTVIKDGSLVSLSEKKSGTNAGTYTVTVVGDAKVGVKVDAGKTTAVTYTGGSLNANRSTVFVYYNTDGASVKVVTGIANMSKLNAADNFIVSFSDEANYKKYVFIQHGMSLSGASGDDFYYLLKVTGAGAYNKDDETVRDIAAIRVSDGSKVDPALVIYDTQYTNIVADTGTDSVKANGYYFKGETTDGITELTRVASTNQDAIISGGAGYTASTSESIILASGALDFASDVVVISVAGTNRTVSTGTGVLKANGDANDEIFYVANDKGEITFLAIEVK